MTNRSSSHRWVYFFIQNGFAANASILSYFKGSWGCSSKFFFKNGGSHVCNASSCTVGPCCHMVTADTLESDPVVGRAACSTHCSLRCRLLWPDGQGVLLGHHDQGCGGAAFARPCLGPV